MLVPADNLIFSYDQQSEYKNVGEHALLYTLKLVNGPTVTVCKGSGLCVPEGGKLVVKDIVDIDLNKIKHVAVDHSVPHSGKITSRSKLVGYLVTCGELTAAGATFTIPKEYYNEVNRNLINIFKHLAMAVEYRRAKENGSYKILIDPPIIDTLISLKKEILCLASNEFPGILKGIIEVIPKKVDKKKRRLEIYPTREETFKYLPALLLGMGVYPFVYSDKIVVSHADSQENLEVLGNINFDKYGESEYLWPIPVMVGDTEIYLKKSEFMRLLSRHAPEKLGLFNNYFFYKIASISFSGYTNNTLEVTSDKVMSDGITVYNLSKS